MQPKNFWGYKRMHFDAMKNINSPLPIPGLIEPYTVVDSVGRLQFNVDSTQPKLLVCAFSPSKWRGLIFSHKIGYNGITQNTLDSESPLRIRPMRMSLRIRNTSAHDDVEGVVRILNTPDPPEYIQMLNQGNNDWPWWPEDYYTSLMESIRAHPNTRSFTAKDLQTTHALHAHPTSMRGMTEYDEWKHITFDHPSPPWKNHVTHALHTGANGNGLSTFLLIFEPTGPGAGNNYDLALHTQDAAVFPVATLAHRLSINPPVGNPETFQYAANAAGADHHARPDEWGGPASMG